MLTPAGVSVKAYQERIFGSGDFSVDLDILDLNERVVGSGRLLDGQINFHDASAPCRRTADFTLSDPAGALDFAAASSWSSTSVWVNRLLRLRHTVLVGTVEVSVVAFVGPPSQMSRSGAEVSVSCDDKTALALRGAPPYVVKEGRNAVDAIRAILADCTGEAHFRFPTSTRRLSKDYAVGWEDAASPWLVANRIAAVELGMQLIYAADGFALLRVVPNSSVMIVPAITEPASASIDFTTINNHVRVFGGETTKTTGKTTIKTQPFAAATVDARSPISPLSLARNGVTRYLPLVITESAYTKTAQVEARAAFELQRTDRLMTTSEFACVPFFHADVDDCVTVKIPGGSQLVRMVNVSIPVGVADDMSIGAIRPVSAQPAFKTRTQKLKWKKYTTGKKGHRKTHWKRLR